MFTRVEINELIYKLSDLKKDLPKESHELIDETCKYIKTMCMTKGNIDAIDPSGKILVLSMQNDMKAKDLFHIVKSLSDTLGNEYRIVVIPSDLHIMLMNVRELNNVIDNLIKVRDSILNDVEARR